MDIPLSSHRSLAPALLQGWQAVYTWLPLCGRRGVTTVLFACCAIALAGPIGFTMGSIGVDANPTGPTAVASPTNGAAALTAGRALV